MPSSLGSIVFSDQSLPGYYNPNIGIMITINGVKGVQYLQGATDYKDWKYQYATSSHEEDHHMNPGLIVRAADKNDIVLTVQYAKENNIAVAIRTGGHQYSGASSTDSENIQLDLSQTFRGPEDRVIREANGKTFAYVSVSWRLEEFNAWLGENHVFVPHGQCSHVGLGGHVQTGGYGQLGRSFGLLGDHVVALEVVDYNGKLVEISKANDLDLFFAFLGGSPGNLGVLTHLLLEVHRDDDYKGSRGLKAIYWYNPSTLKNLLNMVVEMSDNDEFPRNYDYCVSVLSSDFPLPALWPGLDEDMKAKEPSIFGKDGVPDWPRVIVVYAQWVPFNESDVYNEKVQGWFDRINDAGLHLLVEKPPIMDKPMSQLTSEWIFRDVREFDLPYVKRTYLTKSRSLQKDGWVDWVVGRVDDVVAPVDNWQWISAQFQCFGGKYSKFTTNADNGTSYSWRDSSLCATIDNFQKDWKKADAEAWQRQNDQEGIGPSGKFSKEDRRVLWGSYGSYDLDSVWPCYFEDQAKYDRLREARKKADPEGVFTPNTFCVKRAA